VTRQGQGVDREEPMAQSEAIRSQKDQFVMAGKIAVGIVVGVVFSTIVGPIVLAVVIGLATGH
jgi:hypothetical protein